MKKYLLGLILISSSANAAVPSSSSDTFKSEYNKASNQNLPMSQRWAAVMKATDVATGEEFNKILSLANNKDWYMRNASLVALDKSGNDMVYDQAKKLITDKALVVRSASVDILSRLQNDEVKQIFSTEMEKPYNFKGKSSLWIRKQMMGHLIKNPQKSERDFFIKYLNDSDMEVASLSTQALEKITSIRFTGKTQASVVAQWKTMIKNQKW